MNKRQGQKGLHHVSGHGPHELIVWLDPWTGDRFSGVPSGETGGHREWECHRPDGSVVKGHIREPLVHFRQRLARRGPPGPSSSNGGTPAPVAPPPARTDEGHVHCPSCGARLLFLIGGA